MTIHSTNEIKAFEKGQKESTIIYFPNVDILMIKGKQSFAIYFPTDDCLMIKGKQMFAIYFPNDDVLMTKGKQIFIIFQVLASNLGFMC